MIEVCDRAGSCATQSLSVSVSPLAEFGNFSKEIEVAIRSRNLQRVLQLLVGHGNDRDVIPLVSSFQLDHRSD